MQYTVLLCTCLALGNPNQMASATANAPGAADSQLIFSPERAFRIPLDLSDEQRSQVTLCRLYYSTDRGQTWLKHKDVSAEAQSITYRAETDGEIWFSIALVDRQGQQWPADIAEVEPGLCVCVDTQEPELLLRPIKSKAGHRGVRWEIADSHANAKTFRLAVWDDRSQSWQELKPEADKQMAWFAPQQDIKKIQATVADQAGNKVVNEVDIYGEKFARMSVTEFVLDQTPNLRRAPPVTPASEVPSTAMAAAAATNRRPADPSNDPSYDPSYDPAVRPVRHLEENHGGQGAVTAEHTVLSPAQPGPIDAPKSFCNSTKVVVHYEVDTAAGPQRVELWGTRNGGANWTLVGVDQDSQSPIEADLHVAGLWGLRIVVLSPNAPAQVPQPGDLPEMLVEVDNFRPSVVLQSTDLTDSEVVVRWMASDANLSPGSITISVSDNVQGPWTPIAQKIDNSGSFAWNYAASGVRTPVYLRVEAVDQAGNSGTAVSTAPVMIGSRARSAGRVLGVQPGTAAH